MSEGQETSDYPGSLDTWTDVTDKEDLVEQSDINKIKAAIEAIQTELGVNPAGSVTDLVSRLTVLLEDNGTLQNGTSDPATDLLTGRLFYRTDNDVLKVYNGSWVSVSAADGSISQAKLKTSTGEVNVNTSRPVNGMRFMIYYSEGTATTSYLTNIYIESIDATTPNGTITTLPGGEYGFYPQTRMEKLGSYTNSGYAQQRYVTASGKDHWVFLLTDSNTGDILASYSAPDHPMYGNGGDIEEVPHPFIGNDMTGKEVVILGKDDVAQLKSRETRKDTILGIVNREYKVDVSKELAYEKLHSGQFIDKQPVLVDALPTGIKVRGLKAKPAEAK